VIVPAKVIFPPNHSRVAIPEFQIQSQYEKIKHLILTSLNGICLDDSNLNNKTPDEDGKTWDQVILN